MTARILIDGTAFKVSKSAKDVLTALPQDLIINSGALNALGVVMTGSVTAYNATIPFGRTLPFIPRFWLTAKLNNTTWQQLGHVIGDDIPSSGIEGFATQSELIITNHGGYAEVRYVVFNTGLNP